MKQNLNPLIGLLALVIVATVLDSQRAARRRPRLRTVPKPPTPNAPPAAPAPPPVTTLPPAPKRELRTPWGAPMTPVKSFEMPVIPERKTPPMRSAEFEAWVKESDAKIEAILHTHDSMILQMEHYRWQRSDERTRIFMFAGTFAETLVQRMMTDHALRARLVAIYDLSDFDDRDELGGFRFRVDNGPIIARMRLDIAQRILYPDEHPDAVSMWMRDEYRKYADRMGSEQPVLTGKSTITLLSATV